MTTAALSFTGLLFTAGLTLKLTHTIDSSWWKITAPLWPSLALLLTAFTVGVTLGVTKLLKPADR